MSRFSFFPFNNTTDINSAIENIRDTFFTDEKASSFSPILSIADKKYAILPGLCDVHVHFREPGFSYKETIKSGSLAAAHGGYSTVFTMPNLSPAPDCMENLSVQLDLIEKDAVINVVPYGTITVGEAGKELADMEAMAPYVCGFSDDGRGVQSDEMMLTAMKKAKSLNKIIAAHCEVNSLLFGGYIHKGEYAEKNGHRGICSESEFLQIARDIELVKESGVSYHVCHISTKESVDIIRKAKAEGVDITCETGPHYLILCDEDLKEEGRFKMNPPLRSKEDRAALIEGILDGTIDMIATDHAPHSEEEKSKGLERSPFGIVGLETAFPLMYTHFVKTGILTIEDLIRLMCVNPRKRFSLPYDNSIAVFDITEPYKIDPKDFQSMGKATPFENETLFGKCILNMIGDKVTWKENTQEN